ncbi:MAG: hypothetical protein ACK5MV_13940 [Aminipila sp.]
MQNLDTNKQLQNLASEIMEEADQVYAQLNGALKCGHIVKPQKDRILDYVHTKIKSFSVKLSAVCDNEEVEPLRLYVDDEQLDALYFVKNAIHGPTARSNPLLKAYLEDLFYCLESDIREEYPRLQYPSWVYAESLRVTSEYLDETTKRENKYNKQRRKDLKKRGRR